MDRPDIDLAALAIRESQHPAAPLIAAIIATALAPEKPARKKVRKPLDVPARLP